MMLATCVVVVSAAEPITTFKQFYNLTSESAREDCPVRIPAVVVCFDAGWNQLYLHDGQTTAYISPQQFKTQPELGQKVELTGQATLVSGQPQFTNLNLKILGSGKMPPAKRLALTQLGSEYGEWIESTGQVRVTDTSLGRLTMVLRDQNQNCLVYVMGTPKTNDYRWLLDSTVRIRGINASKANQGRLESAQIMAPGFDEVTLLEKPRTNWLQVPVVSISSLLDRELDLWTNNRVHLNGLVAAYTPGQSLMIQDPTGLIRAQVIQQTGLPPETRVDVWGFLQVTPQESYLRDAFFEVVQSVRPTPVVSADANLLSHGTHVPQVLTRVSDIVKLHGVEAARHLPVQLRGVITYADVEWRNCFFQDASGGIYVDLEQPELRAGHWVELTGTTGPGGFAPEVLQASFKVLGTTNLPPPVKVTIQDLVDGHMDAHWIEMDGVVRRLYEEWGHLYLMVTARKGKFRAILPHRAGAPLPTHLVDALVSVRGACSTELNVRRQMSGITLHVPGLEQIQVLEPSPSDPFAVAATPIESVATFNPDRLAGRRIKISGVVTLPISGQGFYVQDTTAGMRVHTLQTNEVRLGDRVEVLGFPALGNFSPHLEEAQFRKIGTGATMVPKKATAEHILLEGIHDGLLVAVEARVLQDVPRSASPQWVLQAGSIVFTARREIPAPGRADTPLRSGSLVRLTGICLVQGTDRHEPKAFRLLLRQPEDIELLESPPWWTARHTVMLAGGLTLLIATSLGWIALLRRQVRIQTDCLAREKHLLATLIDHLPDNVFVKNHDGKYILTNHAHTRFHGTESDEYFLGKSPAEIFPSDVADRHRTGDQEVLSQGRSIFNFEELYTDKQGQPRWLSTTKVPFKDGAGTIHGIVGISRDITERKRAEAELQKTQNELLRASRLAGMAEVATGVLHNVGNVLNTINVSTTLIGDRLLQSKINDLLVATTMLRQHSDDLGLFLTQDAKGKLLPAYFISVVTHLAEEQNALLQELTVLTKAVDHTKDIIAMQQNYAKVSGVIETLPVADLVTDALQMHASALERHEIQVIKQFEPVPPVRVDKHRVLQILMNLLRNAKYAMEAKGAGPDKRLVLGIVPSSPDRVKITVKDTGVGIQPDDLTRIFSYGFTTKKDGHGFGLHLGALAAKELGGFLAASSEGIGRGAMFTLELPIAPPAVSAGTHT